MNMDFDHIVKTAKEKHSIKMAVAGAADPTLLTAIVKAHKENLVEPILIGDMKKIMEIAKEQNLDVTGCSIEDIKNPVEASSFAVKIANKGEADILMKGHVQSADLLREVLNKEYGLRKGKILSHVALFFPPSTNKFCLLTDGGMNLNPDILAKISIIENAVEIMKKLGIEKPLVAPLAAVEVVNVDMPTTTDAALLTQMCFRGQIKDCIIDGPLGLDNAIDIEAAKHKGIKSEVAGKADIILVPDIQAGNILYKSIAFFARFQTACLIAGARIPIILTSRADDEETKFLSIALAVYCA